MRIGIDCRFWNQTGVGRYTRNLVSELVNIDKKNNYVLFARTEDSAAIKDVVKSNPGFEIIIADIPWHGVSEQIKFPGLISRQSIDLMHFPYFSVPIFYSGKFIITIHDLIINSYKTGRASTLPYPLYLAKRAGYSVVLSKAIDRSIHIITPSNAVKSDIKNEYRVADGKIDVIYEGGFETKTIRQTLRQKPESINIAGRYILRIGNYYPHKNVEKLIEAFRDLLFNNPKMHDLKLVLVGKKDYFYRRIQALISDMALNENIIFVENAEDKELISLYKNAAATVIPSLSEGFSLTGVEALSCDSPVLASDIQVHREILGKAAIYCNPHDTRDIKLKLDYIIGLSERDRNVLIKEGQRQAEKYSWEKMARKTLSLYESIKR